MTAIPAPALDLGAILEEVVVQMMKEEDKKEWTARHDRWVNVRAGVGVGRRARGDVCACGNACACKHARGHCSV